MMHRITPLAQYAHHFGIDVSKDHLDIHHLETGRSWRIPNRVEAIRAFITEQASALREALVVVDCTGSYELACCERMVAAGVRVHRTNTYQFRSYVRSCGQLAKTDRLDARMLAQYGRERSTTLRLFVPAGRLHREQRHHLGRRDGRGGSHGRRGRGGHPRRAGLRHRGRRAGARDRRRARALSAPAFFLGALPSAANLPFPTKHQQGRVVL